MWGAGGWKAMNGGGAAGFDAVQLVRGGSRGGAQRAAAAYAAGIRVCVDANV